MSKPVKKNSAIEISAKEISCICGNMNFATSEAYKKLRTNILFSFADSSSCHVIGVTSSYRGEGKSLTSINLSYTMAQASKKVLLIDCDLRLPSIALKTGIKNDNGLSNLLVGLNNVNSTIVHYASSYEDTTFDIIPSGNPAPNPAELLGSGRMSVLIEALKEHYDYIILDLPPVCAVSDAVIVSKICDGMIVVVRQNYCRTDFLKETMDQLRFAEAKLLGFVLNGVDTESEKYGKYGKYGNYYKE